MNQLEKHLHAAINDPSHIKEFVKQLLNSEVYCLGHIIEDEHEHHHAHGEACNHGTEVSIFHWEDDSGNVFIPFFSSLDAMGEVLEEDEPYLCIHGREFFAMAENETLLLNPETELEYSFSPEEVKQILHRNEH